MKNEVYLMDCMEFMKGVPDKYYSLALVDPPYGISINNNIGRRKGDKKSEYKDNYWDSKPPDNTYFKELFRVSKNQIIWGANHFISKIPFDSSCWIVWDKLFSVDVSFASVELAWTSFETVSKRLQLSSKQLNRIHSCQKPVALYTWLLNNYAKQGDKIFDSHVGSGSSRIACDKLGYYFEGCELDIDYWEAQEKRYKNYKSQLTINYDEI